MANKNKTRNDPTFPVNQQYFFGGSSLDRKLGLANGFWKSHNLDFRTFPSQISVLPASQSINSNLPDLVLAMEQDLSGVRYGVGSQGWIYRINTSDEVSPIGQMTENGSAGLLYSQITDQLYIPGQTTVSMYGQCTNSNSPPLLRLNHFGKSASSSLGCVAFYNSSTGYFDGNAGYRNNIISDSLAINNGITDTSQVSNSLTNTYQLPDSITESSTNFCYFVPDIEPFYSIAVYVDNVGTGDWTLTLHDSLNNELVSKKIVNADMVAGWNEFVFGSQIRAYVNASNVGYAPTYHFHLTSSVAGDTASVFTNTSDDLSTCNMLLFAYRLVETNNTWHPTAFFTGSGTPLLCIGNGNYLSTYNFGNDANPSNTQWQRHNLIFKPGDEVTSMTVNNQYLCVFTERRSTDSSRNYQTGTLYLWDGSTTAPNIVITIPMGSPYGAYTLNNVTYFECAGSLYAWSQGVQIIKVRKLAYQNTDYTNTTDQTRLNPNGMTSRYNILMMGYPSSTTNPNLDFGIWSYGAVELTYPNSYGYSYSQSIVNYDETTNTVSNMNYTTENNLQLGCCVNFVDSMYSSWQYTDANSVTHYGLDVVNNSSPPATWFDFYSLIFDGSAMYKQKNGYRYKVSSEALPSGYTVWPFYNIDRGGETFGAAWESGSQNIITEINNARFHEMQWGFKGVQTGATNPAIFLGVAMEIDPNSNEVDVIPKEGL